MKLKIIAIAIAYSTVCIGQNANAPTFPEFPLANRGSVGHLSVSNMGNDNSTFSYARVYSSGRDSASLYWSNNHSQGEVLLDGYGNISPFIDFTHVALTSDGLHAVVTYDNSDNTASFHEVYYEVYEWDHGSNQYLLSIPSTFIDYGFNPYVSVEDDLFVIGYRGISGMHLDNYVKIVTGDIYGTISPPVELSNNPSIDTLQYQHSYGINVFLKNGRVYSAFVCADRNTNLQWVNSYLFINVDSYFDLSAGIVSPSILVDTEPYSNYFTFPMIDGSELHDHLGITVQRSNGSGIFDILFYWSNRTSISFNNTIVTDPSLSNCSNTRPMIAYSGDIICIAWINDNCNHINNLNNRDILYQIYGGPFPLANISNSSIERANNHFIGDQFRMYIDGEYLNNSIQMVYFDNNTSGGQIKYKENFGSNQFRPMGIDKSISLNRINVYPNPFDSNLTLITESNNSIKSIYIIDNLGKNIVCLKNESNNKEINLDLGDLSSGNYVLKISYQDGHSEYHKVTKK